MPKRILTESLFYSLRLRWERFKLAFSEERLRRQGVEMDIFKQTEANAAARRTAK